MTDSLFTLPAFEKAAAIRSQFPKMCSKCGARYTVKGWGRLRNARPWKFPDGEVLELRECVCNSTLSILLAAGADDAALEGVDERRAPVQGTGAYHLLGTGHPGAEGAKRPGTIAWWEHEEAWRAYDAKYETGQSAERMAQRHGFDYSELVYFLGREPTTWRPR